MDASASDALSDLLTPANGARAVVLWDNLAHLVGWWQQFSVVLLLPAGPSPEGWRLLRLALTATVACAQVTQTIPAPVAEWLLHTVVPLMKGDVVHGADASDVETVRDLVADLGRLLQSFRK